MTLLEQVKGVEPSSKAWEASILPIYDTCTKKILSFCFESEHDLFDDKTFFKYSQYKIKSIKIHIKIKMLENGFW